ncbi:MAG: LPS-assembly protein LptD [Verrucomicrobia bacterium]|nr:LPS-assembly protein LptD [Verrucomicrobiota bacterium]
MNRAIRLLPLLLAALLPALHAQDTNRVFRITATGQADYDLEARKWTATENVAVNFKDPVKGEMDLTAQRVSVDENTGDVVAEGMVNFRREGQLWRGERLEYNYLTRVMKGAEFKTGQVPFYISGMSLEAVQSNRVYVATGTSITTDDVAAPGYRIRAKSMIIIPGHSIEAEGATLYLGNTPVLYLPHYKRTLYRHPNNTELTPGFRSLYGAYLLGTYNWYASDTLSGGLHLDYRQRRGFGFGPDLDYDLGDWGKGRLSLYGTRDDKPGVDNLGAPIDRDRHRLSFSHQVNLTSNLTVQATLREQGDPFIVRDFFEDDYRKNIQPNSFLEVNQRWQNWSLNVLAQPRINDFYDTVERLPDVKLTGIRQQLGATPFYYESESSLGYFQHKFADNTLPAFAAWRADTFHQIVLPKTLAGWLNVTPRLGTRYTHYGESDGRGAATSEQNRWVFNTGMETSFKASRTWRGAESSFWDVSGLRHILEPSVNYVFVPRPNKVPTQLPQFDTELASLRLLPIEYPDYNAVDSVDSQNTFRFGLRNKLQTKRADAVENIVNWEVYSDWRVKPRAGQSTFSDVYSDLDFSPRSWVTLTSETRYDIASGVFRLADHNLTLKPNSAWSASLGHRYLRNDPALAALAPPGVNSGNNLIRTSLYWRLNENWGLRATHQFEARDGTMEEQLYTVYRDFRSWTGALSCRLRDNRGGGPSDFTIAFTFSLKAFPRFKMGHDSDTPSLLLGGE